MNFMKKKMQEYDELKAEIEKKVKQMWIVIKINKKKFLTLKRNFSPNLGMISNFIVPIIKLKKFIKKTKF